jgi:hypothetical protein
MFPDFFRWSDVFAYRGLSGATMHSPLGWQFRPRRWKHGEPPDRTSRNFPVQSAAADIMRVASILAFEAGIAICAIIHDAFVIEAAVAVADIEKVIAKMQAITEQASVIVIGTRVPAKPYIARHG